MKKIKEKKSIKWRKGRRGRTRRKRRTKGKKIPFVHARHLNPTPAHMNVYVEEEKNKENFNIRFSLYILSWPGRQQTRRNARSVLLNGLLLNTSLRSLSCVTRRDQRS